MISIVLIRVAGVEVIIYVAGALFTDAKIAHSNWLIATSSTEYPRQTSKWTTFHGFVLFMEISN